MKLELSGGRRVVYTLFASAALLASAATLLNGPCLHAQTTNDLQWVDPKPLFGTFYSLQKVANGNPEPPLPWNPFPDLDVYSSTTFVPNFLVYFYSDLEVNYGVGGHRYSTQTSDPPDPPGGGGTPGDDPGIPNGGGAYNYTNGELYIVIGPTNNNQAWLVLSNTHSPLYYQLDTRAALPTNNTWVPGQIIRDTQNISRVRFDNTRTDYPVQRFFRGVEGNTVVSIVPDPDYNLAMEPSTNGGTAQAGKFLVTLSTNVASPVTIVYMVSGQASNGGDYSSLSGSVVISAGTVSTQIVVTPTFDTLPEFDESVTLSLVRTNGYLVDPDAGVATLKIYDPRPAGMAVAIHDSGWTRFNKLSNTNWNYFVLPEAMKEALRSDGTPYAMVSDLDIANGVLTNANGTPKYPILISLAAESIRDDETNRLTEYVNAGGFIFAGSSSFTRRTNGTFRSNFALATQMGIGCNPSTANWYDNTYLTRLTDHRLVHEIPDGNLVWRMPNSPEETSWGDCATHGLLCVTNRGFDGAHQIWVVTNSTAQVLAVEDGAYPYITVNGFGNGYFLYDAALQPLIGHGGFGPGMYAYIIFRRSIEWAFETAQRPIVKLSPWPYQYDAAFMIRHDLEDFSDEVADVENSARIEYTNGAYGDYYFCTGKITNDNTINFSAVVTGLRSAVSNYGATIGPHNGGLPNPRANIHACCVMNTNTYEYWHWGPDEALDLQGGKDYASNSLAISFSQIETWITNQIASPRTWCAPYFNATREDSYEIEEALNVKVTGDQKLTPFPAFTISTRTDGKRYDLLSEPVSDWFVNGWVAQSMDPWHDGVHSVDTVHDGVTFYYTNGFLVNFYAHALSTGFRSLTNNAAAGALVPDYLHYCMNTQTFPRLWSTNARGVYHWWVKRAAAQISTSYSNNGAYSVTTVNIAGSQHTNLAIEIATSGFGIPAVTNLMTNGVSAGTSVYRTARELIKVRVGTAVTNVQIEYYPGPIARPDYYTATQGQTLTVSSGSGVLSNDFAGTWPGLLAATNGLPEHGLLSWNTLSNGAFAYTASATNFGTECFSYRATDGGANDFGTAMVTLSVKRTNDVFSDNFTRCASSSISPWQPLQYYGTWSLNSGAMQGFQDNAYGYCYISPVATDCSVEAKLYVVAGSYAGGLGGRLNTANGAHYAAWIYPEDSPSGVGAKKLALIKFYNWTGWSYNGSTNTPMAQVSLSGTVSNTWHTLKLTFNSSHINVYYDDNTNPKISVDDTDSGSAPHSSGSVSLDLYDALILVDDLSFTSP